MHLRWRGLRTVKRVTEHDPRQFGERVDRVRGGSNLGRRHEGHIIRERMALRPPPQREGSFLGRACTRHSGFTSSVHDFEGTKSLGGGMTGLGVLFLGTVLCVVGTLVASSAAEELISRKHPK